MAEAPQLAAPQGLASSGADDGIQATMPAAAGVDDALQASAREDTAGRLPNPFEAQCAGSAGKKGQPALKSEIFEVLREHPSGLELADIVRSIKERKLRTFVGKAVSQVHLHSHYTLCSRSAGRCRGSLLSSALQSAPTWCSACAAAGGRCASQGPGALSA